MMEVVNEQMSGLPRDGFASVMSASGEFVHHHCCQTPPGELIPTLGPDPSDFEAGLSVVDYIVITYSDIACLVVATGNGDVCMIN